jgi:predicted ATPase/DNA-binding SARP family transcriptional activator
LSTLCQLFANPEKENMEGTLRLRLLGPAQVEQDGQPLRSFKSRKALALLSYLAVQGKPTPREHLVDLLWGDKSEARGRANLSWVLHKISTLLPGCLEADRRTVQFQRAAPSTSSGQAPSALRQAQDNAGSGQAPYWLDIVAFEELEAQGDAASLAAAAELYRGELLEGMYLDDCAEFELWLVTERERWRQRVARVLGELVTYHSLRGQYQQGLRFARRLLELEPWREKTHQQVMRLLAYRGQRGAALAQYEICRRVLAEELGVGAAQETTQLYERIRDGELRVEAWEPGRWEDLPVALPSFLTGEETVEVERPVFVTRERELAQLQGFLDQALTGQGQVVFVTGDAGQGKTALIREFARRAQAAHPDLVVASGHGNAHIGIGDPYLPFREILALLTGDVEARWTAGAITRDRARRLWYALPLAVQALVEAGPDLIDLFVPGAALVKRAVAFAPVGADWLSQLQELVERKALRRAQDIAALSDDPNLQQSALFEQYTRVVEALARQRPLLLVLDDLQWADAGSTSLLFHLGRRIEGSQVLIVGAYRPEEVALGREGKRHPLEPVVNEFKRHFGDIVVDLGKAEDRQFVDAFLDTEPNRLDDAFRQTLYRQTRGHPLFTIELLRGMEERGDLVQDEEGRWVEGPALDWETLPARVEAVIAERIGRLPERLQDALAVASVEGETFTAEVVARVRAADEQEVVGRLSGELDRRHRLVSARGILRADGQRLSLYRFQHILFQKYLYSSLDPVEQAHLHQAVGTALEALYREGVEEIAVQLARHFQEAGIAEKAQRYLYQAGERAMRMSANREATAHFTRGLKLLRTLPETPKRDQRELDFLVALGVPLILTKGHAAPEVEMTYTQARELSRQVGETPQLFQVLHGLRRYYFGRGELQTAHELGEQLLTLARGAQDPNRLSRAHMMHGEILYYLGEFAQAREHCQQGLALYDPQQRRSHIFLYGNDTGAFCQMIEGLALWHLGYPDQALKRTRKVLTLAQELSHPFNLAVALYLTAALHQLRREVQTVQERVEALLEISAERRFAIFLAWGTALRGWALAEQGEIEEGIAQMQQGLAIWRTTGGEVWLPIPLSLLAEADGKVGKAEEGLALLTEGLGLVDKNGERCWEAELHRLKGELLLKQNEGETCFHDAEPCFRQALEVARCQSAKSWELRAAMSLSQLWQKQGKREEARKLLTEIYGWFTEGFDTPDLKEAKALLEELS